MNHARKSHHLVMSCAKRVVNGFLSHRPIRNARKKILSFTCSLVENREGLEEYCRLKGIDYGTGIYGDGFLDERILVTAKSSNRIIGHTMIGRIWETTGITSTFSGKTWVHPLFRGLGVGSAMLELSLKEAGQRGVLPVLGSIDEGNSHSLAMCLKLGFVIVDLPEVSEIVEKNFRQRFGEPRPQIIVKFDASAQA